MLIHLGTTMRGHHPRLMLVLPVQGQLPLPSPDQQQPPLRLALLWSRSTRTSYKSCSLL